MDNDSNASGTPLTPPALFEDFPEVLRRAQLGVREALRDHALVGNPIAVWRGEAVVIVSAEEAALPKSGTPKQDSMP